MFLASCRSFCGDQLGDGEISGEQQRAQHDVIGSTWLQMRGFEYKVAHIVEGHVLAKRYLTGTDKSYNDQLSSVRRSSRLSRATGLHL